MPSISEYDVGQILGKGGFAVVYRARVRSNGQEVAIKVVDKKKAEERCAVATGGACNGTATGRSMTARVVGEVRLHWQLKHPAVVELLDFFEDERFVYMILELCEGGDLYRRLKAVGPLPERAAALYMGQLISAITYLHAHGVAHRDLKLSNLLLSLDGSRLKLADFGLATTLTGPEELHTICGTPNYIAPEIVGQQPYGLAVDLWGIGCLFHTLVTGRAPFQGARVVDTLANVMDGRYQPPAGLSPLALDFMRGLLQVDPNKRPDVHAIAAHPFLRLDAVLPPLSSSKHIVPGSPATVSTHVPRGDGSMLMELNPADESMRTTQPATSTTSTANTTAVKDNVRTRKEGDVVASVRKSSQQQRHQNLALPRNSMKEPVANSFVDDRSRPACYQCSCGQTVTPATPRDSEGGSPSRERVRRRRPGGRGSEGDAMLYREGSDSNGNADSNGSEWGLGNIECRDSASTPPPPRHHRTRRRLPAQPLPPPPVPSRRSEGQRRQSHHNHSVGAADKRSSKTSRGSTARTPLARLDSENTAHPQHSNPPKTRSSQAQKDHSVNELFEQVAGLDSPVLQVEEVVEGRGEGAIRDIRKVLQPFSTARIPPFFHSAGGVDIAVSADGRASLSIAATGQWMMVSGDGMEVHGGKLAYSRSAGEDHHSSSTNAATVPESLRRYHLEELPDTYRASYRLLAASVEALRARAPKVVLKLTDEEAAATFALMENGPLPDFRAAWQDGARLVYSLRSGELEMLPPPVEGSDKQNVVRRWRLSRDSADSEWQTTDSSQRHLRIAQRALLVCLHAERAAVMAGEAFPLTGVLPALPSSPIHANGSNAEGSEESEICARAFDIRVGTPVVTSPQRPPSTISVVNSRHQKAAARDDAQLSPQSNSGDRDRVVSRFLASHAQPAEEHSSRPSNTADMKVPRGQHPSSQDEVCVTRPTLSLSPQRTTQHQQSPSSTKLLLSYTTPSTAISTDMEGDVPTPRIHVHIPGLGVAARGSAGDLEVLFEDGPIIEVGKCATWLRWREKPGEGKGVVHPLTGKISGMPSEVKRRMRHLPVFISRLKAECSAVSSVTV